MEKIRLNKFLSQCGVASRRAAEKLMEMGMVKVNGIIVREMGVTIDPENDSVLVADKQVRPCTDMVYYILNKPVGYITTASDPHDRKKVTDLVPKNPRVYPVGRLDHDTSGLLILTNDGDFTYEMTHPKFEKEKEYELTVKKNGLTSDAIVKKFQKGVNLSEGVAKADKINVLEEKENVVKLSIVIHQGWNRQIRRMCEMMGLEVVGLKRVRIGDIRLGELEVGKWRKLSEEEIKKHF
ncbi:MAG: pseudouridine synthase [Patescibacteria group bacterium]|nr:pseudouridine synthase [Patescibacteria group bacterium]